MKITFEFDGQRWASETGEAICLGIEMDFEGDQPNHFGAPKAVRTSLQLGGFVGDTQQGGSCNVDTIQLVPHCNGTHTETIGHIVDRDVPVSKSHIDSLTPATLLRVESEPAEEVRKRGETYRPPLDDSDRVIGASQLEIAFSRLGLAATPSLILVTDSDPAKKSAAYTQDNQPPFLSVQAMQWIVSQGFQHLLVDFPSVDRMYDEGLLTNHHLFWNVPEATHELNEEGWTHKTITEMVYVPASVESGLYLLNMQLPGFQSDAAPSRPVIMRTRKL